MQAIRVPSRRQRGASILVVLVMVAALGLLTLTTFLLSRNQYRLVGNIQHLEQAFGQAEAAAVSGEIWLDTGSNHRAGGLASRDAGQPGLYPTGWLDNAGVDPRTMNWSATNSVASGDGRYLIERLAEGLVGPGESLGKGGPSGGTKQACRAVDLFRVVSRSESTRAASRTIESTYATTGCAS